MAVLPTTEQQIEWLSDHALRELREELGDDIRKYTGPEFRAMHHYRMLRLTNKIEVGLIEIRGILIEKGEQEELWAKHPQKYSSAEEADRLEGKLSITMRSNIKALREVIYPYIEKHLGMTREEFHTKVGWSNSLEIIPYLKRIITGQGSKSNRVNRAVEEIYDELDEALPELDEEEKKAEAVERVIEIASNTNQEMRKALRASDIPIIDGTVIKRNGKSILVAELSEDQLALVLRKLGDSLDLVYADDNVPVHQIPQLKQLMGGSNG